MINVSNRIGKQTVVLSNKPVIVETASIVGIKEGEGPLRDCFDRILTDDTLGEKSWEKSESTLQRETAYLALNKAEIMQSDVDYVLAGDLLNQCAGAHYSVRDLDIPFLGLYGACSTMSEGMSIGSMLVDGGFANRVMCMTSSHFCSSERQFRNPLEYGGQRTPSAQWTVTGAGCVILAAEGDGPKITHVTTGKIVDKGITDITNMGAAMAPAAIDTLIAHFNDTGRSPDYYDMILTGDLGVIGSDILTELMLKEGFDIRAVHHDCGKMIYDIEKQDVHAGGSGCGCFGSVFCGYAFNELKKNNLKKILVMATGALMNPTVIEQGESIPGVAHAVAIEN